MQKQIKRNRTIEKKAYFSNLEWNSFKNVMEVQGFTGIGGFSEFLRSIGENGVLILTKGVRQLPIFNGNSINTIKKEE